MAETKAAGTKRHDEPAAESAYDSEDEVSTVEGLAKRSERSVRSKLSTGPSKHAERAVRVGQVTMSTDGKFIQHAALKDKLPVACLICTWGPDQALGPLFPRFNSVMSQGLASAHIGTEQLLFNMLASVMVDLDDQRKPFTRVTQTTNGHETVIDINFAGQSMMQLFKKHLTECGTNSVYCARVLKQRLKKYITLIDPVNRSVEENLKLLAYCDREQRSGK
jgi:hypothetical protein